MLPPEFMSMFSGGGQFSPAFASMMQQPEQFGMMMADAGVPPPLPAATKANGASPPGEVGRLAAPAPVEQSSTFNSSDFGAGSTPGLPTEASPSGAFGGAASGQKPTLDKLMSSFRGVQAPKPPEFQRIQSPSAPRPSGQAFQMDPQKMLQMLMSLGSGGGGGVPNIGELLGKAGVR